MENKRKLVTLRRIAQLLPIDGADRIELAVIDGWEVIVKKGEFELGSQCIFFEIDSFLPKKDIYEFLLKTVSFEGREGYRLKTMKMRGVVSQGLALPLSHFKNEVLLDVTSLDYDTDYSDILEVIKYDNQTQTSNNKGYGLKTGNSEGVFPDFIPKTDQERIQNLTRYFQTKQDEEFEETLKMDGSSCTMYKIKRARSLVESFLNRISFGLLFKDTYEFGVCSRNLNLRSPTKDAPKSDFWNIALKYDIENILPSGYAIQGELCGPGIQSNHEKLDDKEFFLFDVYDITNKQYLLPEDRWDFYLEHLQPHGIKHVRVVTNRVKIFKQNDIHSLLKRVEGPSLNQGVISEGRVYKSHTNRHTTFKVINNQYLLKDEK